MNEDLAALTREQLVAEVERLREGIRAHHQASGPEVWRRTNATLYALLPASASTVPILLPPLYFGCVESPGHSLWDQNLFRASKMERAVHALTGGVSLDGTFCPGVRYERRQIEFPASQPEGAAALHHLQGHTVLSFWDRSVDRRGNCSSTFVLPGLLDFEAAVEAAVEAFPGIWQRYTFTVRLA